MPGVDETLLSVLLFLVVSELNRLLLVESDRVEPKETGEEDGETARKRRS
jgi:hypothetical protein